jgi:ribosomal-protein-alanine N-acetyltransferase
MKSIRPLAVSDLDQVYAIENRAHSHPWSENMIRNISSRGACHYVLCHQDKILGYYYAQHVAGEVNLLNLAVCPDFQGQGHGKALIDSFVRVCEKLGAESAWLEVRESNTNAFRLYQHNDFNEVDRRLNYYPTESGKEDAIIMCRFFL